MTNQEILSEIEKILASCEKNLSKTKECEAKVSEAYGLINQYVCTDDIEKRIKDIRISNIQKIEKLIGNFTAKRQNTHYGKVSLIDLADCENWIMGNLSEVQRHLADIDAFVQKYPFKNNSLGIKDIDDYILGKGRETFCWNLENRTPGGMGQQSAFDYYIYWSEQDKAFAIRDGNKKRLVKDAEANHRFDALRSHLEKMLMLAASSNIDKIDEERRDRQLPNSNILQKIIFLYFPEEFIGYYSNRYIDKIAAMLGINSSSDVFQTNNLIAEQMKDKITDPKLSKSEKTVGFTIYLWHRWNDYIRQAVA